jgi:hypothetical protein
MRSLATVAFMALLASCGGADDADRPAARGSDTLTQRQRDSILAGSRIPGASGVGKAMRVADSTSARAQAADTVGP